MLFSKKINSAIIGLGNIGLLYDYNNNKILTHAKSISKNKNLSLVAGFDQSKKKRKFFEKKYKIKSYSSFNQYKEFDKIKLLVISSSTDSHLNVVNKIPKKNNIKYIILEKPGGKNYKELLQIINFCKKRKILLSINYIREFLKDFNKFKKIIKKIKTKKIIFWYSKGMLNNGSHLINFILSIYGWPKKIETLNKYNAYSKEIDYDFRISYKTTEIYFFCTPIKNISHNEIFIKSKNFLIFSKNDFNTVFKKKNNSIKKKEIVAKCTNKLQLNVLEQKIFNFKKNKKFIERNLAINLMTLKLIDIVRYEKNY